MAELSSMASGGRAHLVEAAPAGLGEIELLGQDLG